MKDYDIKIKGGCEVTLYGTSDNTIVVPSDVKLDADGNRADIEVSSGEPVKIGIPAQAEKVELEMKESKLFVKDLAFEQLEIDGKGTVVVDVENVTGSIEINMVGGNAVIKVPADYSFKAENRGRGTEIENELSSDDSASNRIELNGKDSVLKILAK